MRVIGGLLRHGLERWQEHDDDLRAMATHAGAGQRQIEIAGGFAVFWTETPARVCHEGRVWLLGDIALTNTDELRETTGRQELEEVLLSLYERHGPDFVARLHGGFSIALWDARKRMLLLAVDRFGINRLYHATTRDAVVFASRADVVGMASGVDTRIDPTSVFRYLNFGYVPGPASIFRGIRRLPPGHLLVAGSGTPTLQRYWDLTFTERPQRLRAAAHETFRETEAAVARAVHGVPPKETGAFLSGGTDSSTMMGLMSRLTGEAVKAFSIGFADERYNELSYAELSARHFGAAHHIHVIDAAEARALLPRLIEAYDEPFGNDSAIGTAVCARLAADAGVTHLVAGDGGDEIFGGNERYRTDAVFGLYHRVPGALRRFLIEPSLGAFRGKREGAIVTRAKRYVRRANIPNPERFYSYEFHFSQQADALLAPEFVAAAGRRAALDVLDAHWARCASTPELNRLLYMDMKLTIGDNDLYKVTRTAEMVGVRVAFPMLDPRLVDFMASVPARYKVHGLEKRYLFRRAFRDLLPPATLSKRKHGFGVPAGAWLRDDRAFSDLARDALLGPSTRTSMWFQPGAVQRLFDLHAVDATTFYGCLLWTVLMLELWQREHATPRRQP